MTRFRVTLLTYSLISLRKPFKVLTKENRGGLKVLSIDRSRFNLVRPHPERGLNYSVKPVSVILIQKIVLKNGINNGLYLCRFDKRRQDSAQFLFVLDQPKN